MGKSFSCDPLGIGWDHCLTIWWEIGFGGSLLCSVAVMVLHVSGRLLCEVKRVRGTFVDIRSHFDAWLTPFMDRFLPSSTFNNIFLVVQTGPFLCLSLGTRLPPSVEDVQRFYDDYVLPAHGPRCVEDVKLVWNDACIFLARTPEFPCQLWLLLGEPSLDSIQLDYGQDLSQWPSPPGRVWYPSETKGNVGIAFLQDIATAAESPGPSRLFNIPAKPPWPDGVPEVAFSDDEIHGSEGQPLHSQAEVARRWSEHFGAIEGGAPGKVSDLVAAYVADFDGHDGPPPLLQDLPSLQDWEASFAGLNSRKSPGPGGLSAAFVNMDRPALASQTFPLC